MIIAPAILAPTFEQFSRELAKVEDFTDYVQIDVMDGVFVNNTSFKEISRLSKLSTRLRFELHLMVADPLAEMKKWRGVKNVFRVIFHAESASDPLQCIRYAREAGWQVGVAINPETPLAVINHHLGELDLVLFMTVHPGKQGALFIPAVLKKIKQFIASSPRPLCAVDGGVNKNNIRELSDLGVDIVNVGKSLVGAEDAGRAHAELIQVIEK